MLTFKLVFCGPTLTLAPAFIKYCYEGYNSSVVLRALMNSASCTQRCASSWSTCWSGDGDAGRCRLFSSSRCKSIIMLSYVIFNCNISPAIRHHFAYTSFIGHGCKQFCGQGGGGGIDIESINSNKTRVEFLLIILASFRPNIFCPRFCPAPRKRKAEYSFSARAKCARQWTTPPHVPPFPPRIATSFSFSC
jgi:hypothetical protein